MEDDIKIIMCNIKKEKVICHYSSLSIRRVGINGFLFPHALGSRETAGFYYVFDHGMCTWLRSIASCLIEDLN
jgi:hypothetical protein